MDLSASRLTAAALADPAGSRILAFVSLDPLLTILPKIDARLTAFAGLPGEEAGHPAHAAWSIDW